MDIFLKNKYTKYYLSIVQSALSKERKKSPEEYFENHHIIPKCMGGGDEDCNIVCLTAREHFICHLLLTKMTIGKDKQKMYFSLKCMLDIKRSDMERYSPKSSKLFEYAREKFAKALGDSQRGSKKSDKTRNKMSEAQKRNMLNGKNPLTRIHKIPKSIETRRKMSESRKGKPWPWVLDESQREKVGRKISEKLSNREFTEEHKKNLSLSHIGQTAWNKGKKLSEEQTAKMRKPKSTVENMKKPKNRVICPHCSKEGGQGNMTRYHFDNCKERN